MFALKATRLASQTAPRRFASAVPKAAFTKPQGGGFGKTWLSDPSTYPLIVIMGFAVTFMVGMSVNALTTYKDVQISPSKRSSILQTWGTEDRPHLLKRAVHWNSFQKNMPEGLGVDHKKWVEEKKAQSS